MISKRLAGALVAGALAASLSSCESATSNKLCPDYARLMDTEHLTVFRPGGGHDITDILYEAELTSVGMQCKSDKETMNLDVTVNVVAKRGPTATEIDSADLPVFAVASRNDKVVVRTGESLNVDFDSDGNAAKSTTISFELERHKDESAKAIEVLVGFVLSRDQLAYNRFRHGGPAPGAEPAPLPIPEAAPLPDPGTAAPPAQ